MRSARTRGCVTTSPCEASAPRRPASHSPTTIHSTRTHTPSPCPASAFKPHLNPHYPLPALPPLTPPTTCTPGKCFLRGPRTVGDFCALTFPQHRDADFIVYDDERYTYGELEAAIAALGHAMTEEFGLVKGDRVAVSMRNYPEWAIAFIAAMRIGCIAVPLNSLWKEKEMAFGLANSGARLLVCDPDRLDRAMPCLSGLDCQAIVAKTRAGKGIAGTAGTVGKKAAGVSVHLFEDVLARHKGAALPEVAVNHDDFATIMYTSGTTGKPKGVVQTHRGICNQMMMGLLARDMKAISERAKGIKGGLKDRFPPCIVAPVPLFHVTGSHHILLASLVEGRKLVLMSKWDAGKALEIIEKERVTMWTGVPTMVSIGGSIALA